VAAEQRNLLVLYDGHCGFCEWCMAWLLRADRARRLQPVAIQSERGQRLLAGMSEPQRLESWHVCDGDGLLASGGAGLPYVLALLPAGGVAAALARRLPRRVERAYRWVAAHRTELSRLVPRGGKARARRLIAARMQ
jgi:predicted DCC family thiol-disulfide oxidoreductase YuxK